jgi:WD40 repeat protein
VVWAGYLKGGLVVTGSLDGIVRLWDDRIGVNLAHLSARGERQTSVAAGWTTGLLVSGSAVGNLTLWDARPNLDTATEVARIQECFVPFELVGDALRAKKISCSP